MAQDFNWQEAALSDLEQCNSEACQNLVNWVVNLVHVAPESNEKDHIKTIVGWGFFNHSSVHPAICSMSISTDMYFHAVEYKASLSKWKMQQEKWEEHRKQRPLILGKGQT